MRNAPTKKLTAEEQARNTAHRSAVAQRGLQNARNKGARLGRPIKYDESCYTKSYKMVGYYTPAEMNALSAALQTNVEPIDVTITFSRRVRGHSPKIIYTVKKNG